MEQKKLAELTDEELLLEKKKQKRSEILHATIIGFLVGIFIFGMVSWSVSPIKQFGFFIPMLIPIIMIYRMLKNSKNNKELDDILKERNLN